MIDFIGDIHGHLDRLEALLQKLGYEKTSGVYRHPSRKALFLGDYVDRGPQVREVLFLVRSMVEAGAARALLGNHEFNLLAFWTFKPTGYLRKHTINKILMHAETLRSFQNKESEFADALKWLLGLPIYIEEPEFRAQHAGFDASLLEVLKKESVNAVQNEEILCRMISKEDPLFKPIECFLKGPEMILPKGLSYRDSEGVIRYRSRIRWWENPKEKTAKSLLLMKNTDFEDFEVPKDIQKADYYKETEKPVFFGHYWLEGLPQVLKHNVCCLDYSVATSKGNGKLVAYRFDGEQSLSNEKFVFV
ncbi:MAG: metallophosphoesterase [Fibrobacter sp.]|jgi:hypothetical protein|nr:metallophosphoesterase [Fibrobacter sp.]